MSNPKGKLGVAVHETMFFNLIIACAVVANAIQLGVELDYPEHTFAYWVMDHVFTATFTAEMVIKIFELRWNYFHQGWNQLDFTLVMLSILDSWILPIVGTAADMRMYSVLRILRALRVIRAVRVLRVFKELWKIVRGIIDSFKTIVWAVLVLILVLYVCGIFCCTMIGKNTSAGYYDSSNPDTSEMQDTDFDINQYYGTVPRAMFTLFETSIEPLNIRPVIERQPWMMVFFLGFIFLTTFGVMNVIVGVIVDHTMSISQEAQHAEEIEEFKTKMTKLEKLSRLCIDEDGSGTVSPEELKTAMKDPVVLDILEEVHLPSGMQSDELFSLIDAKGTGTVTSAEMMMQLTRTVVHSDHQKFMELKIQANATRQDLNQVAASMTDFRKEMREGLADLQAQIQRGFSNCFLTEGDNFPARVASSKMSSTAFQKDQEQMPLTPVAFPENPYESGVLSGATSLQTTCSQGKQLEQAPGDDARALKTYCASDAVGMKKMLEENPDCPEVTGSLTIFRPAEDDQAHATQDATLRDKSTLPASQVCEGIPNQDNDSMVAKCGSETATSIPRSKSTQLQPQYFTNASPDKLQQLGSTQDHTEDAVRYDAHPPLPELRDEELGQQRSTDVSKTFIEQSMQLQVPLPSVPTEPASPSEDEKRCSPAMPPRMSSVNSGFVADDYSGRSSPKLLSWHPPSFPKAPKAPVNAMSARGGVEEDGVPSMRDWKL
eukprot:gnl/MRDRNA2_/MRDRNA2_132774_c0_seq1.p1 gnl/MRDRNA2_/MRDRNA2_132774_c0~~gnl/MRDRNA2_/MRDRNA2_132774_c0_seq1.p1  ORF type:complete len:717 (-),score=136.78 gnl/MRDRNA2_/MRDRNA2_132774_c0_seq1:347-2497(-)